MSKSTQIVDTAARYGKAVTSIENSHKKQADLIRDVLMVKVTGHGKAKKMELLAGRTPEKIADNGNALAAVLTDRVAKQGMTPGRVRSYNTQLNREHVEVFKVENGEKAKQRKTYKLELDSKTGVVTFSLQDKRPSGGKDPWKVVCGRHAASSNVDNLVSVIQQGIKMIPDFEKKAFEEALAALKIK